MLEAPRLHFHFLLPPISSFPLRFQTTFPGSECTCPSLSLFLFPSSEIGPDTCNGVPSFFFFPPFPLLPIRPCRCLLLFPLRPPRPSFGPANGLTDRRERKGKEEKGSADRRRKKSITEKIKEPLTHSSLPSFSEDDNVKVALCPRPPEKGKKPLSALGGRGRRSRGLGGKKCTTLMRCWPFLCCAVLITSKEGYG